jgi:hypothetical protein
LTKDTPPKGIKPEDWGRTTSGLESLIQGLNEYRPDLEREAETDRDFDKYRPIGFEVTTRGMPTAAMRTMGLMIGGFIELEEMEVIDGEATGRSRKVKAVVTGIFFDGFAYVPVEER